MLNAIKTSLCALALIGSAASAEAKPTLYVCTLGKGNAKNSWISESTAFIFNPDGSVQVLDGLIMHFFKEAYPAKARKRGDSVTINWVVKGIDDAVGTRIPRVVYQAKMNQKAKTFEIRSRIPGFENVDFGRGTCELGKT